MKVVVVGSGGREHALAHVLARTSDVVVTPGNPGIPWSTDVPAEAIDADLYVIGPEQPLVDGLADRLRGAGKRVFGPNADGARLEGSKAWMKQVLVDAGVPTAAHRSFGADETDAAVAFLRTLPGLYVVKTDGLAAGKGVLVTTDLAEAEADVREKLSGISFGAAGSRVVIEEGMTGPELSLLYLCDGERVMPLAPAQDFKRIGTGDTGPNTGGMGAYSPVALVSPADVDDITARIVEPTLATLRRRGIDYRGVLYAGLMLTPEGPKTLEYNVRFGDPETQVVVPRLETDLAELLGEVADGRLRTTPVFSERAAVTVVAAAPGYPSAPQTGAPIEGLDLVAHGDDVMVFYAGVGRDGAGRLVTAGGRVLALTALGATLAHARDRAYHELAKLRWPGIQVRSDIALAAAAADPATRR